MRTYDFLVWEKPQENNGALHLCAQLRRGEEIVFTLQTRVESETIENEEGQKEKEEKALHWYILAPWQRTWEQFLQNENARLDNILNAIESIGARKQDEYGGIFASPGEEYIWIKIILALLTHLEREPNHVSDTSPASRIRAYLRKQYNSDTPSFFDRVFQGDNNINKIIWSDIRPFMELSIITGKDKDDIERNKIQLFLEKLIRKSRKAYKEATENKRLPLLGLLQLYAASLVFSVNTSDLGKRVSKIFRLDEEVVDSERKRDMLVWAVERVGALQSPPDLESRQAVLIHAIGDNYFRNYDIDNALAFWERLKDKPFPLPLLIQIYAARSPYVLVGSWIVALLLLWLEITLAPNFVRLAASTLALSALLLLLGVAASFIWHRGFVFGHLFLQRLVGASIIGLSILSLTPEGWRIGLYSNGLTWMITIIATIFLAWSFMFFRIYRDSIRSGYTLVTEDIALHKKAFALSSKILSIHAIFTIIIVFLVSGFLAHIFIPELQQSCLEAQQRLASHDWVWGLWEFGFSPKLILFWSSVSIFMGSFVQLLWEDREVTSE